MHITTNTYTMDGVTPEIVHLPYMAHKLGFLNTTTSPAMVFLSPNDNESVLIPAESYKELSVLTNYYRIETAGTGDISVDVVHGDASHNTQAASSSVEKSITGDSPVDSQGEPYRRTVEFDLTSPEAYADMVARYPDAWNVYYGTGAAPAYSGENALRLQEAISFYLYISTDETYATNEREDSVQVAPYFEETGSGPGTYENPNAVHDAEVYNRVTNNGADPLPRVEMDGDKVVGDRVSDNPNLAELYSEEQKNSTEYQTTRNGPKKPHDWGGPYATGKNTF